MSSAGFRCPFCGGPVDVRGGIYRDCLSAYAFCTRCGMRSPEVRGSFESEDRAGYLDSNLKESALRLLDRIRFEGIADRSVRIRRADTSINGEGEKVAYLEGMLAGSMFVSDGKRFHVTCDKAKMDAEHVWLGSLFEKDDRW